MTEPDPADDRADETSNDDTGNDDTGNDETDHSVAAVEPTDPVERTGVAAADEAAQRLADLADAPVEAHVGIYEDVHRRLPEGLADLDEQ